MQFVIDIAQWAFHHRFGLGAVTLGALILALIDHLARRRREQGYDAWWFFNLRPAAANPPEHAPRQSGAGRDGGPPEGEPDDADAVKDWY